MTGHGCGRTVLFVPSAPHTTPRSPAVGELADVVAHGLSAIAIQAEAAEAVLARNPAQAAGALALIRTSALEAVADMRRLLHVLSSEEDGCGRAPQPGLDDLPTLVARACALGQPVTLEVTGTPRPLGTSAQLAVFRVVQEALSAAREHAPGTPTTVAVTWSDAALEVTVADQGVDGRDLELLRERVLLHGGRLEAGVTIADGYRVRATFPA
jgi:signal transduction histidine kinase